MCGWHIFFYFFRLSKVSIDFLLNSRLYLLSGITFVMIKRSFVIHYLCHAV